MYVLRNRRQILRALQTGPLSFWQLLPRQDASLAEFVSNLKALRQDGLLIRQADGLLALTPRGNELVQPWLALQELKCKECQGSGMQFSDVFSGVLVEWNRLAANRPKATQEFDQGYITPEDSLRRIMFMYQRGDLEGQSLLFLGDDDLTSLAAALTGLAASICVLDIDQRLVEFLNRTASEQGWNNFHAQAYDVQDPLPREHRHRYQTSVTDPVETNRGFPLFVSRCTDALGHEGDALYVGLTRLETNSRQWRDWLTSILGMGFSLTDLIPSFHHYQLENASFVSKEYPDAIEFLPFGKPDAGWYTSGLVRLEAVTRPESLYRGQVFLGDELYSG